VVGRSTGIDDAMLAVKTRAVRAGLERLGAQRDPACVLSEVGGLEIAALAGFIVVGASARVPVVPNGVIFLAAAVTATSIQDDVNGCLIAGHRSIEPGVTVALEHLGLRPPQKRNGPSRRLGPSGQGYSPWRGTATIARFVGISKYLRSFVLCSYMPGNRTISVVLEQMSSGEVDLRCCVQFVHLGFIKADLMRKNSPKETWAVAIAGRGRLNQNDRAKS